MVKAIIVFCSILFLIFGFAPSGSFELTTKVIGLDQQKGNLVMAIYRSTDNFPSDSKPYKHATVSVSVLVDGKYCFKNLPKNTYALAIYQDVNKNGKLDKNLFGVPTERYGFSNNARGTFGAPSFSEAKFELTKNEVITIKIR